MARKPISYYKITRSGPKSSKKPVNALKAHARLLKRIESEGDTKWLQNAMQINILKLKKYGLLGKIAAVK